MGCEQSVHVGKAKNKAKNEYGMIRDAMHSLGDDVFLFADADPDGMISAIIFGTYRLEQGKRFNRDSLWLTRGKITPKDIQRVKERGYNEIAGLDFWPIYTSDDAVAEINREKTHFKNVKIMDHHPSQKKKDDEKLGIVEIVNPYLDCEKTFKNMTELLYGAIKDEFKSDSVRTFARDINAIGIVSDYCTDGGQETLAEVVNEYQDIFPKLKKKLGQNGKLTQDDMLESGFGALSEMFYSPYIIKGGLGTWAFTHLCVENEPFTMRDLMNEKSTHPAIQSIRATYRECSQDIDGALSRFKTGAEFYKEYHTAIFEPNLKYRRATSLLSNKVGTANPEWIVGIKNVGRATVHYDFRNRSYDDVPVGEIFKRMGIGGGHVRAAGCTVPLDWAEYFEKSFMNISKDCIKYKLSEKPKSERDAIVGRLVKTYWTKA